MSARKPARRVITHRRPGELPAPDSTDAAAMFDAAWRKSQNDAKAVLRRFLDIEPDAHIDVPGGTSNPAFTAYVQAGQRNAARRRRALGLSS